MLQPNSLYASNPASGMAGGGQSLQAWFSSQTTNSEDVSGKREALLQSLMLDDLSPAKRAVIERLVTLWLSNQRLDAA